MEARESLRWEEIGSAAEKLQLEAEALLGVRVDVLTPKFLPETFRDWVVREAVPV